ncbi:MAG TPA: hypothetical protein VHF22_01995, partial [Planctomycetota bacterium]|nr:hypothetical protein [Planctomycetota bacterium]
EVAAAAESASGGHFDGVAWSRRHDAIAEADIVVNATPLGQHPDPTGSPVDGGTALRPGQVCYDLVYNPARTRFLALAGEAGATTIGGLAMLVSQGVEALAVWLGLRVDPAAVADVRKRCQEELERRAAWVASGT